jgi:hypothetical protein
MVQENACYMYITYLEILAVVETFDIPVLVLSDIPTAITFKKYEWTVNVLVKLQFWFVSKFKHYYVQWNQNTWILRTSYVSCS